MNQTIVDEITEKLVSNGIIFSKIRDERTHVVCQNILAIFEANYTSVKGMEEIIKSFNSTDLQKNVARENLEILGKAFFRAVNLFFRKYKQNLITSVLDPEMVNDFLPEEFKGLGVHIMMAHLQATEDEKKVLLKEREKLTIEKERLNKERLENLKYNLTN